MGSQTRVKVTDGPDNGGGLRACMEICRSQTRVKVTDGVAEGYNALGSTSDQIAFDCQKVNLAPSRWHAMKHKERESRGWPNEIGHLQSNPNPNPIP